MCVFADKSKGRYPLWEETEIFINPSCAVCLHCSDRDISISGLDIPTREGEQRQQRSLAVVSREPREIAAQRGRTINRKSRSLRGQRDGGVAKATDRRKAPTSKSLSSASTSSRLCRFRSQTETGYFGHAQFHFSFNNDGPVPRLYYLNK